LTSTPPFGAYSKIHHYIDIEAVRVSRLHDAREQHVVEPRVVLNFHATFPRTSPRSPSGEPPVHVTRLTPLTYFPADPGVSRRS
jgi:hypothetical protein